MTKQISKDDLTSTRASRRHSNQSIFNAMATFAITDTNRKSQSVHNPLDEVFTITNKDTGESLDIRDVHEETFAASFRTLTAGGHESSTEVEDYVHQIQNFTKWLWDAAESNDFERIKELLDPKIFKKAMAEVNATGQSGYTALHLANN